MTLIRWIVVVCVTFAMGIFAGVGIERYYPCCEVANKPCECRDDVRRLNERMDRMGRDIRGDVQIIEFPN